MKRKISLYFISFVFARYAILVLLSLVIVFHILVLLQFIPYNIVWGGKIQSIEQMYKYEFGSIIINAFLIALVVLKGKMVKFSMSEKIINLFFRLFVILFALNTIGNLFAVTSIEKIIFTPITFLLVIFLIRIVIEKKDTLQIS